MPRGKRLKSFRELCLLNVIQNIDDLWCRHYIETYSKENRFFRYVVGPFDTVPSNVLCELITILRDENRLRRHHLELLITIQLRTLDLSRVTEDVRHPLQLAVIRCPDLKKLNLQGCDKISKQVYQDFLPLLTQLHVLNLSNTKSGDSCLFIIGAYCKELRELDVTSCPVTDEGIRGLCVSVDDLGQASERLGQCKSINKLCVNFTKVTNRGIRMALENLPGLKVFDCCSSVQVLSEMHRIACENHLPDVPKYSLIDLHCTESFYSSYVRGSLNIAVSLCPSLIKIRIVSQDNLTNSDLMALLAINQLKELSISSGEVCYISFNEGIFPLLQAHGHSLETLNLAELEKVNVRAIAECCPNLRSLSLLMNREYDCQWPEVLRPLSSKPLNKAAELERLESLHLIGTGQTEGTSSGVPAEHLTSLLSSSALTQIFVKDCPTLTDSVWKKMVDKHRFPNLNHLELEQCNQLTEQSIHILLTKSNPLSTLKVWQCEHLTRKHAAEWTKKVKKNKWLLKIDWN